MAYPLDLLKEDSENVQVMQGTATSLRSLRFISNLDSFMIFRKRPVGGSDIVALGGLLLGFDITVITLPQF